MRFYQKHILFLTLFFCLFLHATSEVSGIENDIPCLKLYLNDGGRNMSDTPLVVEQINQYIEPILGFHVDIEYLSAANYDRILGQKFLSGENFDILYCNTFDSAKIYQSEGWLFPIHDQILKNLPAFSDLFSDEYLSRLKIGDILYVLPCYHEQAGCWGLEYNADIADACGLDMSQIKSYRDLTAVFETVAEKYPDIFPVAETLFPLWDPLGDELGVLTDISSPTVTDLYSSDFFKTLVKQNYEWYQAGYVLDTVSYPASSIDYLSSGLVFGTIAAGKPDVISQESRITGIRIGYLPLSETFSINDNISRGFFAINSKSSQAEYALRFLNFMYSDQTLANLMTYGIEGVHYEFKDEAHTLIGFPDHVDCTTSHYAKLLSWQCGSQILTYPWIGDAPDVWEQLKTFNQTAHSSVALGFTFDPTSVSKQIENCQNIQATYRDALIQGQLDPDIYLPRFQSELKQAGINEIIAEKQRQLNAFLKK